MTLGSRLSTVTLICIFVAVKQFVIASSSASLDAAYQAHNHLGHANRGFLSINHAGRSFIAPKRRHHQGVNCMHMNSNEDRGHTPQTLNVSYRPVGPEDVEKCYQLEAASYPGDEAASLEKLFYRQQSAGEYFWCATLPAEEEEGIPPIIGFICSTRCDAFTEDSMSTHNPSGEILAIHSVVIDSPYRRQGIASAMMKNYLKTVTKEVFGFHRILLLAKSHLLSFYVDNGFMVLRPSPIVHGSDTWYELEARQGCLQKNVRSERRHFESSRSTSNPDEGLDGNAFAKGRDRRRSKLHAELKKLGEIEPSEMEANPERFGTAAIRTYNSYLMPKSDGALAVADSPTRPRVVANNISFLVREYRADQEEWLRNVDRDRRSSRDESKSEKHPITVILDNVRSAHNVGNIIRLAETSQIDSLRLCGMTPSPPHPKV